MDEAHGEADSLASNVAALSARIEALSAKLAAQEAMTTLQKEAMGSLLFKRLFEVRLGVVLHAWGRWAAAAGAIRRRDDAILALRREAGAEVTRLAAIEVRSQLITSTL